MTQSPAGGPALPQERRLVTDIPGPRSIELLTRKKAAVADGVGTTLRVFVEAAGELMDAVHVGGLGGTYGGNPVACAAALGAFTEMRENSLAERALEIGTVMRRRLEKIAAEHSVVADIRGRGAEAFAATA